MIRLILTAFLCFGPVMLAAQSASLDAAFEAYDAGDDDRAMALAESILDTDAAPSEVISARELIAWIQFEDGRSGQTFLDELITLDADMASFYGADALDRLNILGFIASVSYDLGSDRSLFYEVQIARIARLHPDSGEVHLLSLRNIAAEISNGDDVELALQFSALYAHFAAIFFNETHPTVMEARAFLSLAYSRSGDVLRSLEVVSPYDESDWEEFAQIGSEEAELFAGIQDIADAALADTSVDWPTQINAAVERSSRLAELNDNILFSSQSGTIEDVLPLMEEYLQLASREDVSVAHYSAVLMQAYLEDGQFTRARPYLTTLLSLPSLYLVAIDLPVGPVALTAARNGGVEDTLLDALLAKGLDVEQILQDPDPSNRIDLMTLIGQTKARMGDLNASLLAYENALQALEATAHVDPVTRNNALYGAGLAMMNLGRDDDAIAYFKHLTETASVTQHFDAIASSLTQLALIELRQGRADQAVIYARRKVELEESRAAPLANDIAASKTALAMALFTQSPRLTNELGQVLSSMFDLDVSDPVLNESRKQFFSLVANQTEMSADELARDPTYSDLGKEQQAEILTVLAEFALDAENYDAASAYMRVGLVTAAATSPQVEKLKLIDGRLAQREGRTGDALLAYRVVTDLRVPPGARVKQENLAHLPYHLSAAFDLATDPVSGQDLRYHNEIFQIAQLASTTVAAGALNDAIARSQVEGRIGELLRERQTLSRDLVSLREAINRAGYDGRSPSAILARVAQMEKRQQTITKEIAQEAPELASVWDFNPLRMEAVAKRLRADEALIIFTSSDAPMSGDHTGSYAIALSQDSVIVNQIPQRADLIDLSRAVRCSAALTDPNCSLLNSNGTRGGFLLDPQDDQDAPTGPEFNTQAAHDTYLALFAGLEDLFTDKKRLVIVADQAMISMPFHLALKAPLDATLPMRDGQWLIRDHSIEVIPSVSSFVAMRDTTDLNLANNASLRPNRFLGIGDPLIGTQRDGPVDFECGDVAGPVLTASLDISLISRGLGSVRTDALRDLAALPDTRCELRRLATHFGDDSTVILNEAATETELKALSASGDLQDYSVISFATHGLIAGEIGINDSGLVLTPPILPTAQDDGLLTTQEIAGLRLDADFVILSACNTASGDSQNQEGLSGMASAFFYAGARSLMVSHWPVYSDAAVDLTTRSFDALQTDPTMTRADALRRAMLSILDDPFATPRQSHPSYWAPFMIVGDGLGLRS